MNKKYATLAILAGASASAMIPAFAENNPSTNQSNHQEGRSRGMMQRMGERGEGLSRGMMTRPLAEGKVTAISGNSITMSGHQGMMSSSTPETIFTIDATNAKVLKNNSTSSVSAILVGDTIGVSGTLSGTTITATIIHDGIMRGRFGEGKEDGRGMTGNQNQVNAQAIQQLQGNGQPVIAGTITAINGNSLTITNKANITYSADISTSKIIVGGQTATASQIKVGDMVMLQGTVNGTAVTATTLIDNGAAQIQNTTTGQEQGMQQRGGFFRSIGGFFGRLFGY